MSVASKKTVELFYDVVSPYSWIAFEVLCRYKAKWAIDLKFKPFFLGGIMNESGNRPPAMVPAKGAYLPKDLERLSKHYGVPIKANLDDPVDTMFVKGTLKTQRFLTAVDMRHPEWTEPLSRALWMQIWNKDEDATAPQNLAKIGKGIGLSDEMLQECLRRISDNEVKDRLKRYTQEALDYGAFGSPIIIAHVSKSETEMIFGSDRFHILADILGEKYEGPGIDLAAKL